MRFVLLNLQFSMSCYVDHCVSFFRLDSVLSVLDSYPVKILKSCVTINGSLKFSPFDCTRQCTSKPGHDLTTWPCDLSVKQFSILFH